jgi:predicted ribosome quality control (RQC) complex YloA/Tae2 family protein
MENLEYSYIVEELKPAEGKHFSNIYRLNEKKYRIKVGEFQIILEAGVRVNLAKYIEDSIEPDQLVNNVKKHLDNLKLKSIRQHGGDRVIIFTFQKGEDTFALVFEGFGEGNLVLINEGKTIAAMREESWSDREIRRNKPYSLPKSNVIPTLAGAISEKYIISALIKLPFGKEYSKEILKRCGIEEKKPGNSLSKEEIEHINSEIEKLKGGQKPLAFYSEGQIAGYSLDNLSKFSGMEARSTKTLSEAIDEFYFHVKEEKNEKVEKLKRRIEEQESRMDSLKEEELQLQKTVDFMHNNFEELSSIIETAKSVKLDEVEHKLRSYSAKIDKKNKELEIEITG